MGVLLYLKPYISSGCLHFSVRFLYVYQAKGTVGIPSQKEEQPHSPADGHGVHHGHAGSD